MSILRFLGRTLFSAPFAVEGYSMVTKPEEHLDDVAVTIDYVVPAVQSAVENTQVAAAVPANARDWARITGVVQIAGAIGYATGWYRRIGAVLLVAATLPKFVSSLSGDDSDKTLTSAALLGGALVATQDTHGKPSLAWRGDKQVEEISKAARRFGKRVNRRAKATTDQVSDLGDDVAKSVKRNVRKLKKATQ